MELLLLGVAGQPDDLHPVQQRPGDRLEDVPRRDEEDPREVERQVEVVVPERVVLRRVEHLEHRRGQVAAIVGAHLVDLVDHHDRVHRAGVADGAHDHARHRPDVGAPVAAGSASSRTPPTEMRANSRPSARAIDWPSEVLPTPGGPTKARIVPAACPSASPASCSTIRSLTFSMS